MIARVISSVIIVLALGAGVAFAATDLASSAGTDICVNSTNGLMRIASTCRDGEYPLTIGGGGDFRVAQNGTFTVPAGETGSGKVLPLTGVTLSGRCDVAPPEFGEITLARVLIEAANGQTMDAFVTGGSGNTNPIGQSSVLTAPLSSVGGGFPAQSGTQDAIVTSNGATAAIAIGGLRRRRLEDVYVPLGGGRDAQLGQRDSGQVLQPNHCVIARPDPAGY